MHAAMMCILIKNEIYYTTYLLINKTNDCEKITMCLFFQPLKPIMEAIDSGCIKFYILHMQIISPFQNPWTGQNLNETLRV